MRLTTIIRKFIQNKSGVSLLELLVAVGIGSFVSLGAYQLIEKSGKLTKKAANESELSDSRQIITKILNNENLCTLNLEDKKTGDRLEKLILSKGANKDLSVLEVNKKLNLTDVTPGFNNDKYYVKDMRIISFTQISKPVNQIVNNAPMSLTQGIIQLEITFGRDLNNNDPGNAIKTTFSEIYNTNVVIRTSDGKIHSCSSGINSVEEKFCEVSLRGKTQSSVCHGMKLAPKIEEGPSVTLLKPESPEKFSLTSKDGILIGQLDQPMVNLGAHSRNYLEKFHFFAEKIQYKSHGNADKVLERHEAYFIVSYFKDPAGNKVAPAPYNFRYNYTVYQKNVVTKDNVSVWSPSGSPTNVLQNWDFLDNNIWKQVNDFGRSWFASVESNANPMLHGQIPSHNSALQILNSQEGSIFATNVTAQQVNTQNGHFFAYDYKYSSDKNLKENIQQIESNNNILLLQGYRYQFRNNPKVTRYGFMSDEVKKIFPDAVSKDEDGFEKVDYLSLLSPIIENLKRQNNEVKEMKNDLENLRRNP